MMLEKRIDLIVYDFDGVMTDNRVCVTEDGKESVIVNRGDGYAVSEIKRIGIRQIILSTEENPVVVQRARKLKIEAIHGVKEKKQVLSGYLEKNQIAPEHVLYIGNDLNDYECMLSVGIKGCPADAESEIIEICDWVSRKRGGSGVIRDLLRELIDQSVEGYQV